MSELNDRMPQMAIAYINGSPLAPNLRGYVFFKDISDGVMVAANVSGLLDYKPAIGNESPIGPHGFHIHEYGNCDMSNPSDPFTSTGGHYNPTNQPHGNHAGDFPVLFSNNGVSKMTFFTDKFKVKDIIGRSIIIHQNPDDYRTQPSGNSGKKIGCGTIKEYKS